MILMLLLGRVEAWLDADPVTRRPPARTEPQLREPEPILTGYGMGAEEQGHLLG